MKGALKNVQPQRDMKRLFYFVIAACISAGLVAYFAPSQDIALQWLLGVLVILLILFGGKDLYLYWLSHQAQVASRRGDKKLVKDYYDKIHKLDPDGFVGKFAQGVIHSVDGHWVHAVSNFREALKMRPKNLHVIFNLSICLMRLDRYQEALSYLSYLTSRKSRWPYAYCALGEAHYHLGNYSEACFCLHRELFLHPGNNVAVELLNLAVEAREKAA